jgi:hypothetical protein
MQLSKNRKEKTIIQFSMCQYPRHVVVLLQMFVSCPGSGLQDSGSYRCRSSLSYQSCTVRALPKSSAVAIRVIDQHAFGSDSVCMCLLCDGNRSFYDEAVVWKCDHLRS